MVIALGLWIIVIRTLLGVPGSWQTFLFIVTGVALAVIGFLLRGEALSRAAARPAERTQRAAAYSFVDSTPESSPVAAPAHDHKEGITSLN